MSDTVTAIKVEHVSKTFKLPHERHTSLKSLFVSILSGKRWTFEKQHVLKDVSFEIKEGEFFGIVGRNGSGKSTLLKLLAGIYTQDKGLIQVNGKLTPFIELGVGFNPELTGRENVFLNGALLGFSRKEMDAMYAEIVDFAELDRFMDQKLKNYSSGMQVRLAFSIAIRVKADVLLIDEVLAVGDENFQRKCYNYFAKAKREGQTVVFVTHDMSAVRDFCSRAILLDKGKVVAEGSGNKIAQKYSNINLEKLEEEIRNTKTNTLRWGNGGATIEDVQTFVDGKAKNVFRPDQPIEVKFKIKTNAYIETPIIGMVLHDAQDGVVFATNTKELSIKTPDLAANNTIEATFKIDNIYPNGMYRISGAIANKDKSDIFARVEHIHEFAVNGRPTHNSSAYPGVDFKINKD